MSSLEEKLKALGVDVGTKKVKRKKRKDFPIENILEGEVRATHFGDCYLVEKVFPINHSYGNAKLNLQAPLDLIATWARDERIANSKLESFTFIDTETTGLAGGSGTLAFMVGVGRFEKGGFRLAQFFLRDPIEEPAMLAALESFLGPCETVVSFNGKSFDIPLLNTRYISNTAPSPFPDMAHLDLLHLARRLWRLRLPSRTLMYLEEHILGQTRTEEDTPGWMIPQMYYDYLKSGDARPLEGIFYHNEMDILTLVILTEHIANLLVDPLDGRVEHALDLVAIGRLHQDLGNLDQSALILERALEQDLPLEIFMQTRERLSFVRKRRGEMPLAISLWWQAAADREIYAHVELAKYYEHQEKNFSEARKWTEAALAIIKLPDTLIIEKIQWEDILMHRLQRLEGKIKRDQKDQSQ